MRDKLSELQMRLTSLLGILDRLQIDEEGRVLINKKDAELLSFTKQQMKRAVKPPPHKLN